ncbi:hypothetical protein N7G274_004517 [Stereocaulon virgatum]|uniref:S-adenosyl-L-methionine-dependent methyltransferase n=1 Tax=Stereocaulon virgatum TaxID=373712 RepID=A0ABR4AH79_9LECA
MSPAQRMPSEGDGYYLGRDYVSSSRLNLMHYLWKDVLGYSIHPDIPVQDSEDFRIADVGTGTGIWLIDLSRQLHSARLDGFDISTDQFPPKQWLPENMSLHTLDILKPIPEEFKGKYDVVHARLLLPLVKNNDPTPVLKNMFSLLKPGGYLQWSDHNVTTWSIVTASPELGSSKVRAMIEETDKLAPSKLNWLSQLPYNFIKQGLQDVSHRLHPPPPDLRLFLAQVHCVFAEEINLVAMGSNGADHGVPSNRRQIQEAAKEAQEGAAIQYVFECTVGRKPVA